MDVLARYVHLSGRDIDRAYDEMHGLVEPDEEEEQPDVKKCGRCGELNEPEATFCMRCGFGIDQKRAAEVETGVEDDIKDSYAETDPGDEETQDAISDLDDVMDHPAIKEAISDAVQNDPDLRDALEAETTKWSIGGGGSGRANALRAAGRTEDGDEDGGEAGDVGGDDALDRDALDRGRDLWRVAPRWVTSLPVFTA